MAGARRAPRPFFPYSGLILAALMAFSMMTIARRI